MTRAWSLRWLVVSLVVTSLAACRCNEELQGFPGDLVGVICSVDSGQVLGGAPLLIVDADGVQTGATTDASGSFRAEGLAAGPATVTVTSPDGAREIEVFIVSKGEAQLQDQACHAAPASLGSLSGCVCDEAVGQWVSAANVYVVTAAGSVHTTATDEVGCFELAGVPIGLHVLHIQKGAFFEEHEVQVLPNSDVLVAPDATCEPPAPPAGSGTIDGRVCASDGATWLSGATVYVQDAAGNRVSQDETDAEGRYHLVGVPPGAQVIHIEAGSFTSTVDVVVTAGQTSVIPDDQCTLTAPDVTVAVVSGAYDRVEDVLARIGVDPANITMYDGGGFFLAPYVSELLEDYQALSRYDIVFLNCGLNDREFDNALDANQVAVANLRQFVTEGGSVYASDWAYALIERAWPDLVDFVGDDAGIGSSKQGDIASAIAGTIIDVQLIAAMGAAAIELHYPLPAWVPVQSVAQGVTVYIEGDAPLQDNTLLTDVPHTVGFSAGAGRVIYSSFHQEPGISLAQERVLELLMFEL